MSDSPITHFLRPATDQEKVDNLARHQAGGQRAPRGQPGAQHLRNEPRSHHDPGGDVALIADHDRKAYVASYAKKKAPHQAPPKNGGKP